MEFDAYDVKILGCGIAFTLADGFGMLATEPGLDPVLVLTEILELADVALPDLACFVPLGGVTDIREQIAFEQSTK